MGIAAGVALVAAYGGFAGEPDSVMDEPAGPLAFSRAAELIVHHNPYLESFSWEIRAAEARALQEGLRPNPEFSLELDEVRWQPGPDTVTRILQLGNGPEVAQRTERGERSGFSDAEVTLQLSQDLELGGKRIKRRRLAEHEREVAAWDYEVAKAEVLNLARRDFVEILVLQERVQVAGEPVHAAQELVDRVTRAGLDVVTLNTAQRELSESRIERERARYELNAARVRLAAAWGSTVPAFDRAAGDLAPVHPAPPVAEVLQRIDGSPEVARWAAEVETRKAAVALEKANAVPDVEMTVAYKSDMLRTRQTRAIGLRPDRIELEQRRISYDRTRDNTLLLEFSVPLPIFDRNQGAIREMHALTSKANAEGRAAQVRVRSEAVNLCAQMAAAHAEITILDTEVIPAMTGNIEAMQKAAELGGATYFDVVDAVRDLYRARRDRLDALLVYHQAVADLEKVLGGPLRPETE